MRLIFNIRLSGFFAPAVLAVALATPLLAVCADGQAQTTSTNPQDLLMRMPDAQADGLFQALHFIARQDADRNALCSLLKPDARRNLQSMSALAGRLSAPSRERLANAIADAVVAAMTNPNAVQWDNAAAESALKANVVRAALLHEDFAQNFAADAADTARCQAASWLMDVVAEREQAERVLLLRHFMAQGVAQFTLPSNASDDDSGNDSGNAAEDSGETTENSATGTNNAAGANPATDANRSTETNNNKSEGKSDNASTGTSTRQPHPDT